MAGALLFGYLTDRLGRKKLFMMTLGLYLVATAATALSWDFWSFAVFRVLTGAGIGGEYAAINSAIQELIPARFRGRTDLAINGSFWLGAALGALGAVVLLEPGRLPADWGWRAAFGIGAVLGLVILVLRRWVPESPRWLMLHARPDEADAVVAEIERRVARTGLAGDSCVSGRHDSPDRAGSHPARMRRARSLRDYPQPHRARAVADDGPGVFLQRDLLHLRAGADPVLRRAVGVDRLVHAAVCARQFPRAAAARAAVRHASGASR